MKCYNCDQIFVVKTDPKNTTYDFSDGLRKMEQEYDPDVEDHVIPLATDEDKQLLDKNPIFKLQDNIEKAVIVKTAKERLEQSLDANDERKKNDYDVNSFLRRKNRERKHEEIESLNEGKKRGLNIPLVDESAADVKRARATVFIGDTKARKIEKSKKVAILSESIFSKRLQPLPSEGKAAKAARARSRAMVQLVERKMDTSIFKISK